MHKITQEISIANEKFRFTANIITIDEANELISKLKQDRSTLRSLASSFSKVKGAINIMKYERDDKVAMKGVSDESYLMPKQLLSIIAKLVNCKTDMDFNDLNPLITTLERLQVDKFDREISDVSYNITREDYYCCAGVSDYIMRSSKWPEKKESFKITVYYSAYECLAPKRANGQLVTQNLVEELKQRYSKDLRFSKNEEIPFIDKIDSRYRSLKEKFDGEPTGKESLTLEIIECFNARNKGRPYAFNSLPVGDISVLDIKGDLYDV